MARLSDGPALALVLAVVAVASVLILVDATERVGDEERTGGVTRAVLPTGVLLVVGRGLRERVDDIDGVGVLEREGPATGVLTVSAGLIGGFIGPKGGTGRCDEVEAVAVVRVGRTEAIDGGRSDAVADIPLGVARVINCRGGPLICLP